ncbi:hypothetical protein [Nocardia brasiliensis]|uniref:hypothetical protein n=1 Tax=Nocardia brasiliensis TaxID=37326 RepID=UPI00366C58F6
MTPLYASLRSYGFVVAGSHYRQAHKTWATGKRLVIVVSYQLAVVDAALVVQVADGVVHRFG